MPPYAAAGAPGIFFYTVHNKFLVVFAETGVGGLLIFVAFLVAILREGWKAWRLRDPVLSPIALGCVAGVAGLMVQMNVEPARTDPYSHLIWLCGGLVLAVRRIVIDSRVPNYAPLAPPRWMQT
jgi:O-antigen ligase